MAIAPTSANAAAARPGTQFFAPQVRLVDERGQPITLGNQPVSQDIVSAKVTLGSSSVGQVEVVLNNQRHSDEDRPLAPSWRYNRLAPISFGSRVRVDFRYGNEPWTPMILARITDLAFLFPQAAGAQITLQGEDLASLLKVKPSADPAPYSRLHEIDIVERELSASGAGLTLASPRPSPVFGAALPDTTHKKDKSYLQFIDELAKRMDHEVFVEFDDASPDSAAPAIHLHFEPVRAATLNKVVDLAWGRDLLDFKPTFKVWDMLTEATASGRIPGRRGGFNVTVRMADAINGLHAAPGGASPISAARVREQAFANENRPDANGEAVESTNLDEERARLKATAVLRRSARQFLTADITTLGFTKLRPGMHVNLSKLYAPFDGIYYVTQTVHTLSAAGYLTVSSLCRPGMLDPSTYPRG
ncbi:MAG TPA: hypothetical protein VLJ62_05740 [Burkholderiaceae bacterium]|nr:hypothetical protein [Burkholderiaceae bacterium]